MRSNYAPQLRYDVPAFHPLFVIPTQKGHEMNTNQIGNLINRYESAMRIVPYSASQRVELADFIKFGIRIGLIAQVEQRNPYTFGGVTVSLTDTELANIMQFLSDGRKIQAIRVLRIDIVDTNLTLKEAKDFADHLGSILSASRA